MEEIYLLLQLGKEREAQKMLSGFLSQKFGLKVASLQFLQSAVSLNSFKGSFKVGAKKYFFKTHIEQGGEIAEYAGAELLEKAGYPVISPVCFCNERGRELVVYPWISDPSLFDLKEFDFAKQEALDKRVFEIYMETFERGAYEYPAVQQLFYRRLVGPRFENFYSDLNEDERWIVNGKDLGILGEKLDMARRLLGPSAMLNFSVVGHGDAHNGNVFLGERGLRYFDPAYAGRMDPFLDLTKPIFHNTLARWMYFPEEEFELCVKREKGRVMIDYEYPLTVLEKSFLNSKMNNILNPLVEFLKAEKLLPPDWENRLQSSLLCCPLLTKNLNNYREKVKWLGFARVMEMANFDFNPYLT